jgi:hypothetical protein
VFEFCGNDQSCATHLPRFKYLFTRFQFENLWKRPVGWWRAAFLILSLPKNVSTGLLLITGALDEKVGKVGKVVKGEEEEVDENNTVFGPLPYCQKM